METELQSEKARHVLDLEKLSLTLTIIVILFVTLISSLSLVGRDATAGNPAASERKFPSPELKAL
jgi:hypothetical protein